MDLVERQYETFPYPARDPAEEADRLIEGSPSHPVEIDHFLFGGQRDWTQPFKALVAGGGTGDGLIMLAQRLADIGCPAEITYLDRSEAARAIAEARAKARGLTIDFRTGDLLEAASLGRFDYIDCCGVLHHLADPDAGFAALANAMAEGGGMGLMVYAPHGRTGVYPLQRAFGQLFADDPPKDQVALARHALGALPATNWFQRNDFVGDHKDGDAGLYDLLLHARDRPYRVEELAASLNRAGLAIVSMVEPARYDPVRYLPPGEPYARKLAAMDRVARWQVAEDLAGNIKTHVAYVAAKDRADTAEARPTQAQSVPHLRGATAQALSRHVANHGQVRVTLDGLEFLIPLGQDSARLIAAINGRRPLGITAEAMGLDWMTFQARWAPIHRGLAGFNLLHYSRGARR
ncbi:MAG: class I SAM-dependent methyltransferase [Pseudomonadota bacterium]